MTFRSPAAATILAILMLGATALGAISDLGTAAAHESPPAAVPPPPTAHVAPTPLLVPPLPGSGPVSVPVGSNPDAILVDPTNGTAFVASQFGDNVTAIDLTSDEVIAIIPVGSQPYPGAIALDSRNWTVYVANAASANVSVISIGEDAVIASVPVGSTPDAIAVNPGNHDIYVANAGSGTVSIISPAAAIPRVIDTVPVGPDPDGLAIDAVNHDVFVADAGSDNISVISGSTNTVVASVTVGIAPGPFDAIAYDPGDGDIYVANVGSNNVSVIAGGNFTLLGSIPVGSGPSGLAVDPALKEVYVANRYSGNVSVIATGNRTVVATIPVGGQPATDGAISINPTLGDVYVANAGSANVSVISVATHRVIASVTVGQIPEAVAPDTMTGTVFVANEGSSNITVFLLSSATFRAAGLPAGSEWSVGLGSPPVVRTNTTVHARGTVAFLLSAGSWPYVVSAPAGFALSKIVGPGTPSQSRVNLTGNPATFVLTFGPLESLTFTELGLPTGATWGLSISSSLHHGGPAPQTATSTTASISFTVVKDLWKFVLTVTPAHYATAASHGSVSVGQHSIVKLIKFKPVTAVVLFEEAGLARGTSWQVNVTGPMNATFISSTPTIKFKLLGGTYSFEVSNYSGHHPMPASGTFVLVAPHATPIVETISFSTTPGHARPFDHGPGMGPEAQPTLGATVVGPRSLRPLL